MPCEGEPKGNARPRRSRLGQRPNRESTPADVSTYFHRLLCRLLKENATYSWTVPSHQVNLLDDAKGTYHISENLKLRLMPDLIRCKDTRGPIGQYRKR